MNAISNLPLSAKLALVALVLVTIHLFSGSAQPEQTASDVHHTSDYAMTDFTLTIMSDQGVPSRIIQGKEMAHYPIDDSTEITDPIAEFMTPGKDTWQVKSEKAHTTGQGDNILLTGNVVVTDQDQPKIQLLTQKLNLDTVYNTAYTDAAVTLKSPYGVTHSVGLHADLKDRTINLHSKVRGQYNAPSSH